MAYHRDSCGCSFNMDKIVVFDNVPLSFDIFDSVQYQEYHEKSIKLQLLEMALSQTSFIIDETWSYLLYSLHFIRLFYFMGDMECNVMKDA